MRISDGSSDVCSSDLAALATAHGALARIGVLAVRPEALERLAQATDVVFDKTGTLGDGQPRLLSVDALRGLAERDALRIAAALERDSSHPLRTRSEERRVGKAVVSPSRTRWSPYH